MELELFDWENPEVIGRNKEAGHVVSMPYSSLNELLSSSESPWKIDLCGTWRFKLSKNPKSSPKEFYKVSANIEDFDEIKVPGVWQLQGYDHEDKPYYLIGDYPPAIKKHQIPGIEHSLNTVGSYRREFQIPESWQDRRIYVFFGAVKSAFNIWINGEYVGYSQGSMTPAEFDIGPYVKFGETNIIAVEVFRYSDGTYLEDQNTWFLSGIYREVFIYSEPVLTIRDYFLHCDLDENYEDALFKSEILVDNGTKDDKAMTVSIYMTEVGKAPEGSPIAVGRMNAKAKSQTGFFLESTVRNPKKWSAEIPFLYQVIIVLKDVLGQEICVKENLFGFRKIEIVDNQLLINGRSIFIKGINRHDFDPFTGYFVPKERYEEDIKILKRSNINAIRTSNYPNDPYFYELCDRYGLYVMDEAEVESANLKEYYLPCQNPIWEEAVIDRVVRMIRRDRSHPSIIIWSLGSGIGYGENIYQMKKSALALDGTRLFHYEGDIEMRVSDFFTKSFASLAFVEAVGQMQDFHDAVTKKSYKRFEYETKPALLAAFAPARENSLGSLVKFVEKFEAYPNWCGGFIFDFADKGIYKDDDGIGKYLYGGDFGEEKSSSYLCASGITSSDRTLHPSAYEVKRAFQGFSVKLLEEEGDHPIQIEVKNKNSFEDLSAYYMSWELLEDGEIMGTGEIRELSVAPGESKIYPIILDKVEKLNNAEYHLNINIKLKEDCFYAERDYLMGFEQFDLTKNLDKSHSKERQDSQRPLTVHDRKIKTEVIGEDFSVRISKLTGDITSLIYNDREYLLSPLKMNFWRAATDLDIDVAKKKKSKLFQPDWEKASNEYKVLHTSIENQRTEVIIKVSRKVKYIKDTLDSEYIIDGNGNVFVTHSLIPKKDMVKFGTSVDISEDFKFLSWFGRGMHENYSDRMEGSRVGVYNCTIDEYIHDYLRPQENSNRSDIRWFIASSEEGEGLHIADYEGTLLNVSAWPYSQEDLDKADHAHSIRRRNTITLNIDYKQQGVGLDEHNDDIAEKLCRNVLYKYGYKITKAY